MSPAGLLYNPGSWNRSFLLHQPPWLAQQELPTVDLESGVLRVSVLGHFGGSAALGSTL